jgi:hypothetical protein
MSGEHGPSIRGVRRALLVAVATAKGFPTLPQVHMDVLRMKGFLICMYESQRQNILLN